MARHLSRLSLSRACGAVLLAAGVLVAWMSGMAGAQAGEPSVDVLQIAGPLDRTISGYLDDALAKAGRDGVEVVVVQLDTPGGLGIEVDDVTEGVRRSPVPVAVWVGPPGARAAGAGVDLVEAAHVSAMAPGTVLGPADPALLDRAADAAQGGIVVATGADELSPTELPDGLVPDRSDVRALDDRALVEQGVVDMAAPTLKDVLRRLDGRTVEVNGVTRRLDVDPATTSVRFNNLGLWRRVLHTVANPALAYLLLVAGALAMLFELYQPGFGVSGVSGLVLAALATYGLVVLPTRWWAVALLVAGLIMLAVDLAVAGLGLLTASGAVALTVSSVFLFGGSETLGVPWWLIALVVAFNLAFFVVIMTTVLRAQGVQAVAGAERVIGKPGVVRSMLNPEGHVFVEGALWRARAPDGAGKVKTGTPVRVVGVGDGRTLDVEVLPDDRPSVPRESVR